MDRPITISLLSNQQRMFEFLGLSCIALIVEERKSRDANFFAFVTIVVATILLLELAMFH